MTSVDVAGALRMPGAPTSADIDAGGAGDPSCAVITSYLQTVLNDRLALVWTAVAPPVAGAGPNWNAPVRTVLHHDPEDRSFNERDLPALYLRRTKGAPAWMAQDYRVSTDDLMLAWVLPWQPQERQRRRDRLVNAAGKAVDAAVERMRFPGWVHARDLASADAFLLATPTDTVARGYDDEALDGEVGWRPLISPRPVTITAAVAVGAYSLSPITIDGFDEAGDAISEQVTPPSTDGGWLLTTDAAFARVARVAFPAQVTEDGALSVGHAADDDALSDGSLFLRHAGLMSLKVTGWQESTVAIQMKDGPVKRYEAVAISMVAEERWTIESEDGIYDLDGVDADFTDGDGVLTEQASYP